MPADPPARDAARPVQAAAPPRRGPGAALFDLARRLSNALFGPELMHRSALVRGLWSVARAVWTRLSPAHRAQARFERANPAAPWLVPAAIPVIEAALRPGMRAFEWGAGRSTLWFARQGLVVTAVEGRPAWAAEVRRRLAEADRATPGLAARVTLIEVPVLRDHDVPAETVRAYAEAVRPFGAEAFDLVLVDGHFRAACLAEALAALRPGGLLVVDNADVPDLVEPLAGLAPWRIGAYSNRIWETHLFRKPG
ncbi:MAG: class I SAM-dependent methyltransferase [Alphaproteobacteria bacterium]|nr:class I SAM-dependent methyltransferase [Alphaproteobacteria bacterium]